MDKANSAIWILDAGGTKVGCAIRQASEWREYIYPQGIVPYTVDAAELFARLKACYELCAGVPIARVYYYGSGCNLAENHAKVTLALQQLSPEAQVEVMHDVLGAARAVCGHKAGIASILGTGSSACVYDGAEIKFMRAGLGYILGDEGSGVDLGRRLLRAICYQELAPELEKRFWQQYQLTIDSLIERVYHHSGANQFLASFSQFVHQNLVHPQIHALVHAALESFVITHLLPLANMCGERSMYFIGGVAYHYQDILAAILTKHKLQLAKVLPQPISGLIRYHSA